jgi:prepilin-type N-terminal cleavage/methylation domain-containing protein
MSNRNQPGKRQAGFTLLEMLVTTGVLVIVSGIVLTGIHGMAMSQSTLQNRTEMHANVRSATELMQQEIGQAGRVVLPATATLSSAVTAPGSASPTVSSTSGTAGMFVGEQLVIDAGASEETVTLTAVSASPAAITAIFTNAHSTGAAIRAEGSFASGIVPTTATNGSTGNVLKLYGDINDDGNMVYVEYTCDTSTDANGGNLYRNVMSISAGSKPALTASAILLPNLTENGSACFTYQQKTLGTDTYVVDVAITLTVQTQVQDQQTGAFQTETKALLNVSPRNVFDVWQMASGGVTDRVQPMPPSVTALLP